MNKIDVVYFSRNYGVNYNGKNIYDIENTYLRFVKHIDKFTRHVISVNLREIITEEIYDTKSPYYDFFEEELKGVDWDSVLEITKNYENRPDLALFILNKKFAGCGNPW